MNRYLHLAAAAALVAAAGAFLVLFPGEAYAPLADRTESPSVRVLFLGDVMLDRHIRAQARLSGYDSLLEPLALLFGAHDIVVFNLEGPVTDNPSTSTGSIVGSSRNYVFTFEPASVVALRRVAGEAKLVAHLGNNHIDNFGTAGIRETEVHLKENNISYFGSPLEDVRALVLETPGGLIALVSYNQFGGSATSSLAALAEAPGAFTVLFAHWGEEYLSEPAPYVRDLAHRFVEAGAKMVVGSHPHVFENSEQYNGVHLYYSLGNAIFDQYWDKSVSCGAALSVTFKEGDVVATELIPLKMEYSGRTLYGEAAEGCKISGDML